MQRAASVAVASFVLLTCVLLAGGAAAIASEKFCPVNEAALQFSGCDRQCRQRIESSLKAIYIKLDGKNSWNFNDTSLDPADASKGNWTICSSCTITHSDNSTLQNSYAPSYCCWEGVYCCTEHTSFVRDLSPLRQRSCSPYTVSLLQLRGVNISGQLNSVMDELLQLHRYGLKQLDLSRNFLTGPVPADLGQLGNQLCPGRAGVLATLTLRANNFTGEVDFTNCTNLAMIDLAENGFAGSLPVSGRNLKLVAFRARGNDFSGTISEELWELPLLMTIDLTNNSQLTILDLSDNAWILGTLPDMR
eukprot:gene1622-1962_t